MKKQMKIIDKEGMIFGKLNIIDLAVILFIILLITAGLNRFVFKGDPYNKKNITITALQIQVPYWRWDGIIGGEEGKYFKVLNMSYYNSPKEIIAYNGTYFIKESFVQRNYFYLIQLTVCKRKRIDFEKPKTQQWFVCYEGDIGYTPLYDTKGDEIYVHKGAKIPLINDRIKTNVEVSEIGV